MIHYRRGAIGTFCRVLQIKGSVFPMAAMVALPGAVASWVVKWAMDEGFLPELTRLGEKSILKSSAVWSSFSFFVGFLIVFRTSQAYSRFWDGCTSTHRMRAEWYDACSSVVAFVRHSRTSRSETVRFEHMLIRLFSLLHAVALAEIEDSSSDNVQDIDAFRYELVDVASIDPESLMHIKDCDSRVELVYQWVQGLIVDHVASGLLDIPPPLLSRPFQELANGMCQFHEAIKISTVPFPFPYAQSCDCILAIHLLLAPIVITQFVAAPWWAAFFAFIQIFTLWTLNLIAVEIENPFGSDPNDIDAKATQLELNRHLVLLLSPRTQQVPSLVEAWHPGRLTETDVEVHCSLSEIWTEISREEEQPEARRSCRTHRWQKAKSNESQSAVPFLRKAKRTEEARQAMLVRKGTCAMSSTAPQAVDTLSSVSLGMNCQEDWHQERRAGPKGKQDADAPEGGRHGASMAAVAMVAARMQAAKAGVVGADSLPVRLSDKAFNYEMCSNVDSEDSESNCSITDGEDLINRASAVEDGDAGPRSRWALPLPPQPRPTAESSGTFAQGVRVPVPLGTRGELEGEASSLPALAAPLGGSLPSAGRGAARQLRLPASPGEGMAAPVSTL